MRPSERIAEIRKTVRTNSRGSSYFPDLNEAIITYLDEQHEIEQKKIASQSDQIMD